MEGIKEEVVLSPVHALSLIAAGEGKLFVNFKSLQYHGINLWSSCCDTSQEDWLCFAELRHVGSNNYNLVSSRSHTVFTLVCALLGSLVCIKKCVLMKCLMCCMRVSVDN